MIPLIYTEDFQLIASLTLLKRNLKEDFPVQKKSAQPMDASPINLY
jgi:hypothetical protein